MKAGLGNFLWKISVALYLIANGVLGLSKGGDFAIIFRSVFRSNVDILVVIAGVIALVAGVAVLLEMFNIKLSFLDTLILIVAIIWAVYVVLGIISWVISGFDSFWYVLQRLAVHVMVLSSLLIASKKFG
ncbi:MAG: hypothetical protein FWD26_08590 [Treponema sp.]|nr:hypothetical protein [Treponema sp.]